MVPVIASGVVLVYAGFATGSVPLLYLGIGLFMAGGTLMLFGAGGHMLFGRRHFW